MTFSLDPFLKRRHRPDYKCLHWVRDVWLEMTGEDIGPRFEALLSAHSGATPMKPSDLKAFERLPAPVSPCLVLMRRPRTEPHIGIYLDGRIAHMTERGAYFQVPAVATLPYRDVTFYR